MPLASARVASVNFVITSRRAIPLRRTCDMRVSLQISFQHPHVGYFRMRLQPLASFRTVKSRDGRDIPSETCRILR